MGNPFPSVVDVSGVYGPAATADLRAPQGAGYAGTGGRIAIGVDQALKGMRAAHAQIQMQKYNAMENQYQLADRALKGSKEALDEARAQGRPQEEIDQLYAQYQQAWQQRKQAYDEMSGFFSETEGKGRGGKAKGDKVAGGKGQAQGEQPPSRGEQIKKFLHDLLVGPDPRVPAAPAYPGAPPDIGNPIAPGPTPPPPTS